MKWVLIFRASELLLRRWKLPIRVVPREGNLLALFVCITGESQLVIITRKVSTFLKNLLIIHLLVWSRFDLFTDCLELLLNVYGLLIDHGKLAHWVISADFKLITSWQRWCVVAQQVHDGGLIKFPLFNQVVNKYLDLVLKNSLQVFLGFRFNFELRATVLIAVQIAGLPIVIWEGLYRLWWVTRAVHFNWSKIKGFIFVKVFGTVGGGLSFEEGNGLLINVLMAVAVRRCVVRGRMFAYAWALEV